MVAPRKALLLSGNVEARRQVLQQFWDELAAQAFEELCRRLVSQKGEWQVASRWWQGNAPEWDLVAESLDGSRLLLGEVKWNGKRFSRAAIEKARRELAARPAPALGSRWEGHVPTRALFVPELAEPLPEDDNEVAVYTLGDLLTGLLS